MHPLLKLVITYLLAFTVFHLAHAAELGREPAAALGAGILCGGWCYTFGEIVRERLRAPSRHIGASTMNPSPAPTTIETPDTRPEPPPWQPDQLALFEDIAQDIRRTLRPGWEPEAMR